MYKIYIPLRSNVGGEETVFGVRRRYYIHVAAAAAAKTRLIIDTSYMICDRLHNVKTILCNRHRPIFVLIVFTFCFSIRLYPAASVEHARKTLLQELKIVLGAVARTHLCIVILCIIRLCLYANTISCETLKTKTIC